ncbi:SDR family oxidoreductase [Spongisporangium articulatum]|uniref:SDR family oxidoreductase n=1 Tax=Spongisporangium articulatum TaxID=3362603 RepID=A0ABW8AH56_9ACTN
MTEEIPAQTTGRRVLVTGGASGLGKAMVTRFASEGWRVLATDIDDAAMSALEQELGRSGSVTVRRLDVRDDSDWLRARQWCEDTWGGLDLLVNNAGVAAGGRMETTSLDDWDWILELNLKSVVRGCRTFIPLFKAQGSGYIVNTASLAGIAQLPAMASYNTTKAAVIALSQTLRYELKPYGIGVSVLCPAFVKTNLGASMRSADPAAIATANKLIDNSKVTPAQIADKVFAAVQAERFLILTERDGRVLSLVKRVSPSLVEKVVVRQWSKTRRKFDTPVKEKV